MAHTNKTVIIYFSKDGNTRIGANSLQQRIGGKIIELKEKKKGSVFQALRKKGSQLDGDPWTLMQEADEVYLMSPIWASHGVPAMNAFLKEGDFHGKTVHIITFQQFEDLKNSDKVHQHYSDLIESRHGLIQSKTALVGGKMDHCAEEVFIQKQIEQMDI